ncbi:MAG: UDP-N-acetyl-D-mannosamine dehydrogenase [Flavobacteriales bacterium]|nr:UDP-N-acetyl-D-mannosamine dehydrogenase [Flavobacteriales bacterium]
MAKVSEFQRVSVIGLGYIGLPTAAVIASRGIQVIGVDVSQQAVDIINSGQIHIVEPDLDIVVRGVVSTGNLRATLIPEPADVFMIAVPTPFKEGAEGEEKAPDLSYIQAAAKAIAPVLEKGNLVILESTSPVGATEQLAAWLKEERSDLSFPQEKGEIADINVAYCPERVLPGYVLQELVSNDRIVGGMTPACAEKAVALYSTFVRGDCLTTTARTAEMAKLTENAFRDVNIAFANELSIICDKLKINVWELIKLSNRHPRVNILNPGPGVGGHCIAVDPWFIVSSAPEHARLIKTAREVNDSKPHYVVERVRISAERFKAPVIACLGLSFKADIDDLRESPAVDIVKSLADSSVGQLLVVEPNVDELPDSLEGKVAKADLNEALSQADIVLLLVDHKVFKQISAERLHGCVIIDTRGVWG